MNIIVDWAIQLAISVSGKASSPTKGDLLIKHATFTPISYCNAWSWIVHYVSYYTLKCIIRVTLYGHITFPLDKY